MMDSYDSSRVGHRHGLMLLSFFGVLFMYMARANLSISMVAMVGPIAKNLTASHENSSTKDMYDACPHLNDRSIGILLVGNYTDSQKTYAWDSNTQGLLHGAFYYGYVISQVFGGWISHRIGAKFPIGISIFSIGILTLLSPLAADNGVWLFFIIRLVIGLGQGIVYPSITVLWSRWAPPNERGRLLSTTYAGAQMGVVVGIFAGGFLADAYGWESIYYCYGTICCMWSILWLVFAYDYPESHPRISKAERDFISSSINACVGNGNPETLRVPWSAIVRSVPFLALMVVEFGHNWAFYTLLTNLPTYMNNILHFSLKSNGVLSALPYMFRFILTISAVCFSDWMNARAFWTTTTLRKTFSIVAFMGCGGALVAVGFSGCNRTLAVSIFAFGVAISGSTFAGHLINYTELSTRFAGILIGVGNTVGNIPGILAPAVAGLLTSGDKGQAVENWRIVFLIAAGLYVAISVIFGIFGSARRQPWDEFMAVSTIDQRNNLQMRRNNRRPKMQQKT